MFLSSTFGQMTTHLIQQTYCQTGQLRVPTMDRMWIDTMNLDHVFRTGVVSRLFHVVLLMNCPSNLTIAAIAIDDFVVFGSFGWLPSGSD